MKASLPMISKVSVIVPTYNREDSVKTAIDSIFAQSFQDFEIIVIDDGSTDGTQKIISAYSDSRLRYFYQENRGLPSAWNLGIQKSDGEYIAFLDSDDIWLNDKLKLQISLMENDAEEIMGCVTGYFLHTVNRKHKLIIPASANTALRAIIWKNILHLGTTLLCKKITFDEVGLFDETLRRGQDTDWLIRYRKKFNIGIVRQPLAVYNQHLSRSASALEQSHLYFLEKHKHLLLEQGKLFYRRKTAVTYTDLAYQFYREGNLSKAGEYADKSIDAFPVTWLGLFLIWCDVHLGTQFKRKFDSLKYPKAFK